ncbi:response regulator [candidate division KSB1 bacterium]|nr:MAG: response regulator [candidate division KSB1 bacterium]
MSRILLVDDDAQINEVVKTTLELLGHTVTAVENAEATAEVFAEFKPDVTLVDYALPGRSGLDLLRELGERRPEAIRFLATGMTDSTLLKKALEAGAASILCKPYRMADLVSLMDTAVLLEAALKAEAVAGNPGGDADVLMLTCPAGEPVAGETLGHLIAHARHLGAACDIAVRCLPVAACELMRNASEWGKKPGGEGEYQVELSGRDLHLDLIVRDSGPGFQWQKTLARLRHGVHKARASGLELVSALTEEFWYENDGRTACARISKHRTESDE